MANRPAPANRINKPAPRLTGGTKRLTGGTKPKAKTAGKGGARPSAVKNFLKKYSQAMR
jgi:hypothetical protein